MTAITTMRPLTAFVPAGLRAVFAAVVLYLAFGKGFAYAGYPPVFVGEVVLLVGLIAAFARRTEVPHNAGAGLIAGLLGLAAVQAVADVDGSTTHILEVGRGLAPLYYSLVAFATYALLRDYERRVGYGRAVARVQSACFRAVPAVLGIACVLAVLPLVHESSQPSWPGSGAPMVISKATDLSVTLIILLPLLRQRLNRHPRLLLNAWWVAAVLLAFRSRGAFLALVVGGLVVYPSPRQALRIVAAIAAVVAALYLTGVSFGTGPRPVSSQTAAAAVRSLLDDGAETSLAQQYAGTTRWREAWWSEIWSDVVEGPRVVHGSGWGDNMAITYGILPASSADDPRALRLPHNFFLSVAGRAGLVMAAGLYAVLGLAMLQKAPRDRPAGAATLGAMVRAGLAAALVVSLVDVYLESPQGAIAVWAVVGLSWWLHASRVSGDSSVSGADSNSCNQGSA